MGRFFSSVDEHAKREHTMFSTLACGPIRGRCHDSGVTVETSDGLTVELPINSTTDMRLDRSLLQDGVEVTVNGAVVGHLIQKTHGFRRKDRTMELVGLEPGRYPAGAHFRLRGSGSVSLEAGGKRLAGRRPVILRPYARPDVSSELIAIFVAVSIGLQEPLRSSPAWLPETDR